MSHNVNEHKEQQRATAPATPALTLWKHEHNLSMGRLLILTSGLTTISSEKAYQPLPEAYLVRIQMKKLTSQSRDMSALVIMVRLGDFQCISIYPAINISSLCELDAYSVGISSFQSCFIESKVINMRLTYLFIIQLNS